MQFDFAARELTIKLVYYGPALSGKTSNLRALHGLADARSKGRLMTLETRDDRTLFFDMLPLTFRGHGDVSVRLKLFTVPGQMIHRATRRLVLQGADGVAFIADSRIANAGENASAFADLKENLKANGMSLSGMPVVVQFNKRDLPDVRSDADLSELASRGRQPVFPAVATSCQGVVETLIGLLRLTHGALDSEHRLTDRFGLLSAPLLTEVAKSLGIVKPTEELLQTCLGGALDVLTPEHRGP